MNWITFVGLIAATLSTIAHTPQLIKSWKTKNTKDISLWMYIILVCGVGTWLIYGILIRDIPLIIANTITFILSFSVLILKIKYG